MLHERIVNLPYVARDGSFDKKAKKVGWCTYDGIPSTVYLKDGTQLSVDGANGSDGSHYCFYIEVQTGHGLGVQEVLSSEQAKERIRTVGVEDWDAQAIAILKATKVL